MEILTPVAIFITGVAASFLAAATGGGGALVAIPALIFLGLPPDQAIATDRFGAIGMGAASIYRFHRGKKIILKNLVPLTLLSIVGAYFGANLLIAIDKNILAKLIGILLLLILAITWAGKNFGLKNKSVSTTGQRIGYLIFFVVAVYGGSFGASVGTLSMYVLLYFFGYTFIEGNATEKVPGLFNIIIATAVFGSHGLIHFGYGVLLFAGMLTGGYLGAHTAIKAGNRFMRALLTLVVTIASIKLLFFS